MAWRSGLAYSQDLRERVLAVADGGLRVREVARLFKVGISYVYKALERRAQTGDAAARRAAARRGGGSRAPKLSGHEAALLGHLRSRPDATLAELRRWLFETRGVSVSAGCLWNALDRLAWTLKKVWAGGGAGSPRCRRRPGGVAGGPARPEPEAPGLPRRERLLDQHGAPPWPQPARAAGGGTGAARALEDLDPRRRAAPRPHRRADGH